MGLSLCFCMFISYIVFFISSLSVMLLGTIPVLQVDAVTISSKRQQIITFLK